MHRDVDMLEELNRERREAAAEMGQGRPKDPNVLYGHTIDRYGSPDNSLSGCSIHYILQAIHAKPVIYRLKMPIT